MTDNLPKHVAIVMDGNGRWAVNRGKARTFGHKAGVEAVRAIVESCVEFGIENLTVFAFSSENWRRPEEEVSVLMSLFVSALEREVNKLDKNGVRLKFIGDRSRFSSKLRAGIERSEQTTQNNERLKFNIAANYGGRWDIVNACQQVLAGVEDGSIRGDQLDEEQFGAFLSLSDQAPVDLFIRTGGERRISNFLLWQVAYSELYFSDTLWPDFSKVQLEEALTWYAQRERRFGQTSAQIQPPSQSQS